MWYCEIGHRPYLPPRVNLGQSEQGFSSLVVDRLPQTSVHVHKRLRSFFTSDTTLKVLALLFLLLVSF